MSYGVLNLPPQYTGRDAQTGRFMKGSTPYNKGKKWNEFMSKRAQRRSSRGWRNLEIHRGHSENAGRPKKPVIALLDDGRIKYFPFSVPAAQWVGGSRHNIVRCCRLNALHGKNQDHRYMGVRFYFENDPAWIAKAGID